MDHYERRLPVYLLLDCSESMIGPGMDALQKGLSTLMMDLHSDPHALETVWLSVITFSDHARQVLPLTELSQARVPPLTVRPGTAFGEALEVLAESIGREVRTHSASAKGDWKPMVFLLTDGNPTDEWRGAAAKLKTFAGSRPMNVIAIACGEDVDPIVLMDVASTVLRMDENPESFRALFQWISASLSVTSQAISGAGGGPVSLEKLPGELTLAKPDDAPKRPRLGGLQSQLFMALRCSTTGKPYLMRYRLQEEIDGYAPVATHKIDEDYFAGTAGTEMNQSVSTGMLRGLLPCPHCYGQAAAHCECGQLMCLSDPDHVTCPKCQQELSFDPRGGGGPFDISGRLG